MLCMGQEVNNDMSGQSKDALRVCNVKKNKNNKKNPQTPN